MDNVNKSGLVIICLLFGLIFFMLNLYADEIKAKMDSGCRWVDYIETNADTIDQFRGTDGGTFRLAFK